MTKKRQAYSEEFRRSNWGRIELAPVAWTPG